MSTKIQLRRDTAANWTNTNPVLAQGEAGLELVTNRIKYGDGTTSWNSLAYAASINYNDLQNTPTLPVIPTYSITTTSQSGVGSLSLSGTTFTFTPASSYSLPTASASVLGGVKVDNSTITISNGVISSSGGGTSLPSQTGNNGKYLTTDGSTLSWSTVASAYTLPTASTSVLGGVKVDGTTITINGSGVISGSSTYTLPAATTSALGGVKIDGTSITINGSGVISSALGSAIQFKGTWNASTNSPTLSNGTGTTGWSYIVSTGGTQNLGGGSVTYSSTDFVIFDGTSWVSVSSNAGVASFNTRTGAVTLSNSDVTTALGFTPYNATNPSGYITGINSSAVTTALGFTPIQSSSLSVTTNAASGGGSLSYTGGVFTFTPYALPTATTSVLGGVKIDNSTITISSGVISVSAALTNAVQFKGGWNASTNTPTLSATLPAGVAAGWEYIVSTGGTLDIGNGSTTYAANDLVIYDGTKWVRIPGSTSVTSFNTRQGAITLTSSDVLTTALASQTANTFLAAPSGSAGVSSFRAIVAADIPSLTSAQLATILSDETGTGVAVFGTSPAITTSLTTASTSFDLLNTTATTVNFAGAGTSISIGAATGTTSINNATVTLGNATTINFNGASPTIASTSTGTLTLFNTNLLTVNAFNAATSATLVNSATTLGIGNTATAAQTVNMFTASTGASTYNIATGATLNATTKAINIGTAGVSGSTTNITLGSSVSGALGTTTVNNSLTVKGTVSLFGPATAANTTRFPNAQVIVSNVISNQQNESGNIGIIGEVVGGGTNRNAGVYGVGYTSGANNGQGVVGESHVSATGDTAPAVGVRGYANDTHAGGLNVGLYGDASNGASNYALYLNSGGVYSANALTWTLNGNLTFSGAYTVSATAATATSTSTASSIGYLGLPQSATATTATLAIGDAGKHIYVTTASQTMTIPANGTVAYPIGTTITFIAGPSATTVSIAIATDTMYLAGAGTTGTRTLAANGMATAVKVAATVWYINGTGLT